MTAQPVHPAGAAVPPMPERTPKALRRAMALHPVARALVPDFDREWRRLIADTFDLAPVPAFMARWWTVFAIERDAELSARVTDLEARAEESTDIEESTALLEEISRINHSVRDLEPGQ